LKDEVEAMKIILIEQVDNLGDPGDVVDVRDGYATNYLIPKKLAMDARDKNIKVIEHKKKVLAHKFAKEKKTAEGYAGKIEGMSCTISRKAGENEKLFGSVTSKDIEDCLYNEGIKIDRKNIIIEEPIKTLGIFNVKVKLNQGIEASLKVWVVPEDKKETDQ
jgi:large subunit ribosomal protein L9